ncbi:thioredoxin [Gonapodya prolifera JEL478]|uniref:Thioredoxin n=1 Tax=Gonapodya prolifera (strain JEL478) TaxID=1344416 RepID=A0A139AQM3_GONPJ|nr:thioredoxin [Gonapodya prolifera JEL478]|eukprot:KXS18803.1 thioredoxin [Gonapodya prolifera JEL478]
MVVQLVQSEDEWEAVLRKGPVAVDFFAQWCGPCKMISPIFEKLSQDAKYKNIQFVKVDVDELEGVAAKQEISAMPTFLIFKNGTRIGEMVGASADGLVEMLNYLKQEESAKL